MDILQMKLSELTPYENNPRFNDEAVDKVAESIRQFGFNQPIVVDENNVIVVGHTRYRAAQELGLEEVPVYQLKGLSEEQYRAYRLADNKVAEFSDWDISLLDDELSQIINIDMESLGFEDSFSADDLAEEDNKWDADDFDTFTISFKIPLDKKESIDKYISVNGKSKIIDEIIKLCGGETDD